nr:hypothetical protein [Escherichia coli]
RIALSNLLLQNYTSGGIELRNLQQQITRYYKGFNGLAGRINRRTPVYRNYKLLNLKIFLNKTVTQLLLSRIGKANILIYLQTYLSTR